MDESKKIPIAANVNDWRQLKDSEFLGHWDLPEGKDTKVTIESVHIEEVTDPKTFKKKNKTVISFKDAKKRMIPNVTNLRAIASHHGKNPNGWPGKTIDLFRTTTKLGKEMTECIRVREDKTAGTRDSSQKATDSIK